MMEILTVENAMDLAKLGLQLLGTLFVAWCAVGWALQRFKKEKRWERKVEALARVIHALAEMDRVTFKWIQEVAEERPYLEQYSAELRGRYKEARRELERTASIASILLSQDINGAIRDLLRHLDRGAGEDWIESLWEDGREIEKTLQTVVSYGRKYVND